MQTVHSIPRDLDRDHHQDLERAGQLDDPHGRHRANDDVANRTVQVPMVQGHPRLADFVLVAVAVRVQLSVSGVRLKEHIT